jgi:hypothetical protein
LGVEPKSRKSGKLNPRLMSFLKRISQHYFNEARLMKDLLEADLSDKDWYMIRDMIETHPYTVLSKYITKEGETARALRQHLSDSSSS